MKQKVPLSSPPSPATSGKLGGAARARGRSRAPAIGYMARPTRRTTESSERWSTSGRAQEQVGDPLEPLQRFVFPDGDRLVGGSRWSSPAACTRARGASGAAAYTAGRLPPWLPHRDRRREGGGGAEGQSRIGAAGSRRSPRGLRDPGGGARAASMSGNMTRTASLPGVSARAASAPRPRSSRRRRAGTHQAAHRRIFPGRALRPPPPAGPRGAGRRRARAAKAGARTRDRRWVSAWKRRSEGLRTPSGIPGTSGRRTSRCAPGRTAATKRS